MVKINSPDEPLELGQMPDSVLSIPELDQILKSGLSPGTAETPPGNPPARLQELQQAINTAPPTGNMGGMMPLGMNPNLRPGGPSPIPPGAAIASKLGKPKPDPEPQAINLITTSVTKLNQLADLLMASDEASAKAVRQMIRILGEILKTAEHAKPHPVPPL